MTKADHSIFRDEAIRNYIQRQEKAVLPQFVAPPVFLFLWILLGLLLTAGLLAWLAQVPSYIEGDGIILEQPPSSRGAVALIFLPATSAQALRVGLSIQLHLGSTGPTLTSKIEQVETGILSPSAIRRWYSLPRSVSEKLTEPVVAVSARLGPTIPSRLYEGSAVSAQVQVGSRRVLSLLLG